MDESIALTQERLTRIGNLWQDEIRQFATQRGLQPIQVRMLDYLSRCNRYSDTPAAVTDYFNLTKGTVSQSLKNLTAKGFLTKIADLKDSRSVHLAITEAGRTLLTEMTLPPHWQQAYQALSPEENRVLAELLQALLRSLQVAHNYRSFGVCHTCRHHQIEGEGQFRCGLTQEPLYPNEIDLICREHQF